MSTCLNACKTFARIACLFAYGLGPNYASAPFVYLGAGIAAVVSKVQKVFYEKKYSQICNSNVYNDYYYSTRLPQNLQNNVQVIKYCEASKRLETSKVILVARKRRFVPPCGWDLRHSVITRTRYKVW